MPTIPTLAVRASILARKSLAFAVEETLVAVDIARNYSIRMRQWPGPIATHTKVTSLFCGFLGYCKQNGLRDYRSGFCATIRNWFDERHTKHPKSDRWPITGQKHSVEPPGPVVAYWRCRNHYPLPG